MTEKAEVSDLMIAKRRWIALVLAVLLLTGTFSAQAARIGQYQASLMRGMDSLTTEELTGEDLRLYSAAVVLLAAVTLQNSRMNTEPDEQGGVTVANGIVEVADAQALSKAVGFPVPELSGLPFPVTETTYASYWGELAQISYVGEEQTVTLRVQPGSEDISGDYNNYAEISTVSINGRDVTFKGNAGTVSTAIWTSGGYCYAVSADVPMFTDAMTALIAAIT